MHWAFQPLPPGRPQASVDAFLRAKFAAKEFAIRPSSRPLELGFAALLLI